jgi:hypothetical protein
MPPTFFSQAQLEVARETGIADDAILADILRREISSNDSGHLRSVLRVLVLSHIAANEKMRELSSVKSNQHELLAR